MSTVNHYQKGSPAYTYFAHFQISIISLIFEPFTFSRCASFTVVPVRLAFLALVLFLVRGGGFFDVRFCFVHVGVIVPFLLNALSPNFTVVRTSFSPLPFIF